MSKTLLIGAILVSATSTPTFAADKFTGTAPSKIEDAVEDAIKQAVQAGKHPKSFEIVKEQGDIQDGAIAKYSVTIKVH